MRRVIMRTLSFVPVILLGACTGAQLDDPAANSVRERLAGETSLAVSADSTGTISAARRSDGMWIPGVTDLRIDAGELVLSADDNGHVRIESLALDIGPIAIPEGLLGYPVELTDIHLGLVEPAKVVVVWEDDNTGHGNGSVDLLLEWSLTNHGTTSPLGSPDLPLVPVELSLTGDGAHVHAELRVTAPGELYKWANLIKLEDLGLVLASDTL
jgi:hypothetical protein